VKSLELPFGPRDLPVRVAADQGGIPDPLGDRSHLCGKVVAAPQPRGDAVEEQGSFRI
jgi:hypothetical protein